MCCAPPLRGEIYRRVMDRGTRSTAGGDVGVRWDCGRKSFSFWPGTQWVGYVSSMARTSSFISLGPTLLEDKTLKPSDAPRVA